MRTTLLFLATLLQGAAPQDAIEADWLRQDALRPGDPVVRGRRLALALRRMGVDTAEAERTLEEVAARSPGAGEEERRALRLRARREVRALAFSNPLLDFEDLLVVQRAPGIFPHMSDQHYGWWSRPGGGIYVLKGFKTPSPRLVSLTGDMPEGSFIGPDLSYDGKTVLFAYCRYRPEVRRMKKTDKDALPEDTFYHVYEMNVDGSGRRQLTRGRYDDFDPRYLPGGEIVFLSTRKGTAVQVRRSTVEATLAATQADSYVRCGGDAVRPVAVFTLHAMDRAGGRMRPLSAFENFEWTPAVAADGQLLYSRWDYVDRYNGPYISLWNAHPDGARATLVYGNYTERPQVVFEARSIPGSRKLVFTASAHHSITGGSLALLDRSLGTEFEKPLTRLTPEVCFPETEGWPQHYYANPWPLSEEFHLVAWSDKPLPPHSLVDDARNPPNAMGVYLYDAFGNLELLHRDASISTQYPIPIRPRPEPPALRSLVDWEGPQEGTFLVQDVYQGLEGIARGRVKRLRIVGVPPKVQPEMNRPPVGISKEDPGKFVLGTVPVEEDGSAHFRVPSGVPVFFQALDEEGTAVQTMRSLTYVLPGESRSCIGCHESREASPPPRRPRAALHAPARIAPEGEGTWPLRFDRLVQPVLDARCVSCHAPGGKAPLDLTAGKSYAGLLDFAGGDLRKKAFERPRSVPGEGTAEQSRLREILRAKGGHAGVALSPVEFRRFLVWMDTYAPWQGSYSAAQEAELERLKGEWAGLLDR